ncbi:MAG: YdcF family protein [Candidatus Liberibacter europaeus]|uniref:YdcF family protein n=1 Tax=Candidatus Liberibacter europaeus TaxID=744859 RepID=A0A2T4VWH4_9HYPH|nr:YdcF family protein [Candidatus Liberibacter europaeus]PTL86126.1 MAG: YdcF family protein [Candidatus Liberibacter europaeus]
MKNIKILLKKTIRELLVIKLFVFSLFIIFFSFYWLPNIIIMTSWISFIIASVLIMCIGCGPIPALLLENLQYQYKDGLPSPKWKKDNIIVLLGNGKTIIRKSNVVDIEPSPQSYSRIFETMRLYKLCKQNLKNCTIIISGGDPQNYSISEAVVYGKKLLESGIEQKDIKLETESFNTFQNAKLSLSIVKSIMKKKSDTNIILVSSAYHLKRSQLYFNHFGIKTIASRSDYINVHYRIIPSIFNFHLTAIALKEYIGIGIWFSKIIH